MLSDASDDGDINLGYRKRSVIIELASAYFNNIPLVKYQYFLENYSKEWITIENGEHKAYFTNLKEGTYTFKARSKSNLSDWGPVRQLVIHVDQPFWETDWFQWLLLLLTPILVGLLGVFQLQTQASKMKKKILEAEKMQLEADKVVLKAEVKERDIEIENKSAEIAQKQEKLLEIADLFEKLHKGTEIQKAKVLRNLHKKLESELMEEEEWEALKIYYDQSNHDFSKELLKKYPDLTDNNIRLCILMRLNMNTKEIANMLNVSVLSVQKSRYRLKKRLNIDKDEDLAAFVNSL
jgi:DNA-binding CsgD family transcriptional regulator